MNHKISKIEHLKSLVEGVKKIPIKSRINDEPSNSRLNESSFDINPHEASNIHSEMNDNYNRVLDASAFETKTINDRMYNDFAEDEMLKNLDDPETLQHAFVKENILDDNIAVMSTQNNIDYTEHQDDSEGKKSIDELAADNEEQRLTTHSEHNESHKRIDNDDEGGNLDRPKTRVGSKKIPINLSPPSRAKLPQRAKPKLAPPKGPNLSDFSLKPTHDIHHEEGHKVQHDVELEREDVHIEDEAVPEPVEAPKEADVIRANQLIDKSNEEQIVDNRTDTDHLNSLLISNVDNEVKNMGIGSGTEIQIEPNDKREDKPVVVDTEAEVLVRGNVHDLDSDNHVFDFASGEVKVEAPLTPRFEPHTGVQLSPTPHRHMSLSDFLDLKNNIIALKKELKDTKHELDNYKRICSKYVHSDQIEDNNGLEEYENQICHLKEENEKLKEALADAQSIKHESAHNYHQGDRSNNDYEELIDELKQYYNRLFQENNIIISEKEDQIKKLVAQNKQLIHQHKVDESQLTSFDDFCSNVKMHFDKIDKFEDENINRLLGEIRGMEIPTVGKEVEIETGTVVNIIGADDDVLRKAYEFIDNNKIQFNFIERLKEPLTFNDLKVDDDEKDDVEAQPSSNESVDNDDEMDNNQQPEQFVIYEKQPGNDILIEQNQTPNSELIETPEQIHLEPEQLEPVVTKHDQVDETYEVPKPMGPITDDMAKDLSTKSLDNFKPQTPVPETNPEPRYLIETAEKIEDQSILDQVSTVVVDDLKLDSKEENIVKEIKIEPKSFRPLHKRKLKVTQMPVDGDLFNDQDGEEKNKSTKSLKDDMSATFSDSRKASDYTKEKPSEVVDRKVTNIFTIAKVTRPQKPIN